MKTRAHERLVATRIFLAGVSCVGKTTIGARLAERLGYGFADLDSEIEAHFARSLSRLKAEALTPYSFRKNFAAVVLRKIITEHRGPGLVVALPPSGLMAPLAALVRGPGSRVIVLRDTPDNILRRITFYDDDSRPVTRTLNNEERTHCRRLIEEDIEFFGRAFRRADRAMDIAGLDVEESAVKIEGLVRGGGDDEGSGRAGLSDQSRAGKGFGARLQRGGQEVL